MLALGPRSQASADTKQTAEQSIGERSLGQTSPIRPVNIRPRGRRGDASPGCRPSASLLLARGRLPGAHSTHCAQSAPLRGHPALSPSSLPRLVSPAAVTPAFVLVACGLPAQEAALSVRRATVWAAARHLGRLANGREVAGDTRGVGDHGEQSHAPLALGTGEDVHGERARQKLRPRGYPPPLCLAKIACAPSREDSRPRQWAPIRGRNPVSRQGVGRCRVAKSGRPVGVGADTLSVFCPRTWGEPRLLQPTRRPGNRCLSWPESYRVGWSHVPRCAHNPKVAGSNPAPATNSIIKA